ncbi:MAG: MFS transporter [Bacteroidota bacterium]|nr:MFS transporter [Bacteroidota bacterium]MDX5429889.1 MFS transporter [Bacteroidota bacterium]MDX5468663.1 MFS transporter [Bacteroidota bacterium]
MALNIPRISFEKALLISTLYISQSVPVSFIKTGFQVFLKSQNIPYDSISKLMGLLLLPWAIKFLWAPLVDRFGNKRFGHRKSWILPLQIAGALVLAIAAFLELESQLTQAFVLFLIYSFLCATQDIAVDGLAVLSLSKKQHGVGNSMQMGGYYLGELLGGATILIVFDRFGWTASILALALFFLMPLPFIRRFKEPAAEVPERKEKVSFSRIGSFIWKENKVWMFLVFLYMGNQILARTLLPTLLEERHYTHSEIGFTIGVLGNGASIIGAVLGGILMESFGRKRSLITYGLLKIPAFFLLLLVPNPEVGEAWVLFGIFTNDFLAGLATVALFTVMMDRSNPESPGTDFTIQHSFNAIGVLFFVILSGILLKHYGMEGLVTGSTLIGILAVGLVTLLRFPKSDSAA